MALSVKEEKELRDIQKQRADIQDRINKGTKIQQKTQEKLERIETRIAALEKKRYKGLELIDKTIEKTEKRKRKMEAKQKGANQLDILGNKINSVTLGLTSKVVDAQTKGLKTLKDMRSEKLVGKDLEKEILDIHDEINDGYLTQEGIQSRVSDLNEKIAADEEILAELGDDKTSKAYKEAEARIKVREEAKRTLDLENDRLEVSGAINQAQDAAKSGAESMAGAIGIGSIAPLGIVLGLLAMFNEQQEAIADQFGAMGVTEFRQELAGASQEFTRLGLEGKDALITAKDLSSEFGIGFSQATAMADSVGDLAVSTGMSTTEAAKLVGLFTELAGLSEQGALELAKQVESLAVASGVAPGVVLEDIAKNAEVFAKFSSEGADGLARGAIQARKLGIELSDVASSMESMLDFQGSLNAEVEASVMLGRNINLQRARELALLGKTEEFQKEILKIIGSQEEFDKMNVLQKQALAKATGMGVEQLAKMISKEKEAVTLASALANQDTSKIIPEETITATAELLNNLKALGMELAEAMGPSIEFVVSSFVKLMGMLEKVKVVLPILIGLFIAYKIAAMGLAVANTVKAISGFFAAAADGSAKTSGFGIPAFAAMATAASLALLTMVGAGLGAIAMAGDMHSPAEGKTMVSTKEGGLFEMSKNDDLLAGPGLSKALLGGGGTTVVQADNTQVKMELKKNTEETKGLRADLNRYFGFGGTVANQVGSKVGSANEKLVNS